ncbi:MAG: hypothetical protein HC828_19965, partial [Blastochloris sp.]|nr:hypothetical protein [Blastochloris sp.]
AFRETARDMPLWELGQGTLPEHVFHTLSLWLRVLDLWKLRSQHQRVRAQIEAQPSAESLSLQVEATQRALDVLSARILNAYWVDKVLRLDASTIRGARDYATALVELSRSNLSDFEYQKFQKTQKAKQADALQVFPVWSTTNLSAKSSFALKSGVFDLLIVDEASQCNVPSALPLFYRANRVAVIGDPNQLKHIARVKNDAPVAERFGVDLAAFGYASHSLFDLAARAVGFKPGTILLNEHFRSDARIVGSPTEPFMTASSSSAPTCSNVDFPKPT